ncbi:MAG: TMEM175 family protein [Acidimicrobiia bacterium]
MHFRRSIDPQHPPATFSPERIKTLTDGVIAIVITLLVLELSVPVVSEIEDSSGLWPEIRNLWRELVAYFVSFFLVGLLWLYHHHAFRYIHRADGALITLNMLFLAAVSITPFSSALVASNPDERLAAIIYGGSVFLAGAACAGMFAYASHRRRLVDPALDAGFIRRENLSALVLLVVLFVAAALGYIGSVFTYAVLAVVITYYWLATAFNREGVSAARRADHGTG